MGFAGQVFAARMAVGLAVPSAGALSRTGSMLAKGAGGIYSALAAKRKDAASKRVSAAQEEVNKLKKMAETNAAASSTIIAAKAAEGMYELEAQGKRTMKALSAGGKGAFRGMKKTMGSEGKALFKGLEKATTPLQRMTRMTKNFSKMSDASQKRALKRSKEYVKAKEDAVKTSIKTAVSLEKEKTALGSGDKVKKKDLDLINTRIKAEKRRLTTAQEALKAATAEAEIIRTVSVQAWAANSEVKEKNQKTTDKLAEATEELTEAEEGLATITDEVAEESRDFGAAVVDTVNTGIKNYQEVLLETVAAMTAFYYKLNQNTEAMMEFERELINANSVWQQTNEVMFAAGEQVTQFGQTFGMNMQNGATGLYQLASAGLTADESMTVLSETLKLSMAVQGDHNTIAKLTTQTLKGFDMEMSQAGEITDKFAHAIQKSLIEYEDLGSAVKFALPFFTSTGQSIDQLLGSLQVLTNRALEAGIAGRGLRQALAEFAEHAEDNDAAFRKMGISILDAEGNMKQLSDIAEEFAQVVGEETITNTELLTTLIEDLNVRGATAFVHLVQASDEFTDAVHESANASGELDQMVKVQNESLTAQIQILKNNVQGIFQFTDATYTAIGYQNEFHMTVSKMIAELQGLIVEGEDGSKTLTDFGMAIRDIAVAGMEALHEVIMQIIPVIKDFSQEGFLNVEMLRLYTLPLRLLVDLMDRLGPEHTKMLMTFYIMNKILPITTALQLVSNLVKMMMLKLILEEIAGKTTLEILQEKEIVGTIASTTAKGYENVQTFISNKLDAIRAITLGGVIAALWGATYGTVAYTGAMITATWAAYKLGAATLWANKALLLGWGAIIIFVLAIGKLIYDSGVLHDLWQRISEPGGSMYMFAENLKIIGRVIREVGEAIWWVVEGIAKLISLVLSAPKALWELMGGGSNPGRPTSGYGSGNRADRYMGGMAATGGYLTPMQAGGYVVGERGPELFKPNGGGQLLNNTATNHIMSQSADSGFSGGGGNMTVTSLTVQSAEMNQSNLNIDSFAGNPAMRRRA